MSKTETIRELATAAQAKQGSIWTANKAERVTAFMAAANPATVLLMLDCIEAAKAMRESIGSNDGDDAQLFDAALARIENRDADGQR